MAGREELEGSGGWTEPLGGKGDGDACPDGVGDICPPQGASTVVEGRSQVFIKMRTHVPMVGGHMSPSAIPRPGLGDCGA